MDVKFVLAELSKGIMKTEFGEFLAYVFHDGNEQAIVLVKGEIDGQENVLCRIHSECMSSSFFYTDCDCNKQMKNAQRLIESKGKGLIIYLNQEGRGNGAAAHIATLDLKKQGLLQPEAYKLCGFSEDKRSYEIAAKIINYLQIGSIRLLTSNNKKIEDLKEFGINVTCETSYHLHEINRLETHAAYVKIEKARTIHKMADGKKLIFIIGDLNTDTVILAQDIANKIDDQPPLIVGGTAFNSAVAFKKKNIEPIIFGKIGDDIEGKLIINELEKKQIISLLHIDPTKQTGNCTIIFFEHDKRYIIKDDSINNANDYDIKNLEMALILSGLKENDIIFIVGHAFTRCEKANTKMLFTLAKQTGAKIVLDFVPHNMYEKLNINEVNSIIENNVDLLIGEYRTLMNFLKRNAEADPSSEDISCIFENFNINALVLRYGIGNISKQKILIRLEKSYYPINQIDTGYELLSLDKRKGFGDLLTASLLDEFFDQIFLNKK